MSMTKQAKLLRSRSDMVALWNHSQCLQLSWHEQTITDGCIEHLASETVSQLGFTQHDSCGGGFGMSRPLRRNVCCCIYEGLLNQSNYRPSSPMSGLEVRWKKDCLQASLNLLHEYWK